MLGYWVLDAALVESEQQQSKQVEDQGSSVARRLRPVHASTLGQTHKSGKVEVQEVEIPSGAPWRQGQTLQLEQNLHMEEGGVKRVQMQMQHHAPPSLGTRLPWFRCQPAARMHEHYLHFCEKGKKGKTGWQVAAV